MSLTTFPITADAFADHLRARGCRPATVRAYVHYINEGMDAGDLLATVRKARSRSAYWLARAAIVAYAKAAGIGDVAQVLDSVPEPTVRPRESEPVPEEDWRMLLREVGTLPEPDRSVIELLLLSGLRIGDYLGISRESAMAVVARGAAVIEQKGARTRTWAPSAAVRECLGRMLQRDGWDRVQDFFSPVASTAQNRCRRFLRHLCRRAGVEYANPHRFRHAVATMLDQSGQRLTVIQRALGHAWASTTERYIHVDAREQAAAMDVVAERVLRP